MKRTIILFVAMSAMAAANCKRDEQTMQPQENEGAQEVAAPEMKPGAAEPNVPADNTGKNERDQRATALTPGDQSESAADRSITQQARQGVVGADDISASAKNVKIITVDGVVTLRGPVENAKEKQEIAALVKKVEGVKRVDNQLEIAAK